MVTFRVFAFLTSLFVLAAPVLASPTIGPIQGTKNCVTYASGTSSDNTKVTECLVVKKKIRHARRHYRTVAGLPRPRPSYAAGMREDVWRAIRNQALREDLWRQFDAWWGQRQAPSP